MPERGTGPSGRSGMVREEARAGAEAGCLEAGALPAADSTSSSVMRPKLPVPHTRAQYQPQYPRASTSSLFSTGRQYQFPA
eukprot:3395477-Rhodomonas_salina.1